MRFYWKGYAESPRQFNRDKWREKRVPWDYSRDWRESQRDLADSFKDLVPRISGFLKATLRNRKENPHPRSLRFLLPTLCLVSHLIELKLQGKVSPLLLLSLSLSSSRVCVKLIPRRGGSCVDDTVTFTSWLNEGQEEWLVDWWFRKRRTSWVNFIGMEISVTTFLTNDFRH